MRPISSVPINTRMRIGRKRAVSNAAVPCSLLMEHHLTRSCSDFAPVEAALLDRHDAPDVEHDKPRVRVGGIDISHVQIRFYQELAEPQHRHAAGWVERVYDRNCNDAPSIARVGCVRVDAAGIRIRIVNSAQGIDIRNSLAAGLRSGLETRVETAHRGSNRRLYGGCAR